MMQEDTIEVRDDGAGGHCRREEMMQMREDIIEHARREREYDAGGGHYIQEG